jgi:hypothetical protein
MSLVSMALDGALDMLGQNSKHALLFHLNKQFGISVDGSNSFTFEQLRLALESLLGSAGVDVILERVLSKMDELAV